MEDGSEGHGGRKGEIEGNEEGRREKVKRKNMEKEWVAEEKSQRKKKGNEKVEDDEDQKKKRK